MTGYGVFKRRGEPARVGYRTPDGILDLAPLGAPFTAASLNPLLAQGRAGWARAWQQVQSLRAGGGYYVAEHEAELRLPFTVGDFVDFYASIEHATNMGRLFRPDTEPLLPNWRHLPVGYHGRAGTVFVSGTPVVRPSGQRKAPTDAEPSFGPTNRLDIELELGFVAGVPSRPGEPVPVSDFREHVFGVVLVNDWSARDIQAWEYQPLGPFLGKSFATSIAAWVTPLDALEHAWVPGPAQDPLPLPYLRTEGDWNLDIDLEVELDGVVVSRTNTRGLYWSMPQQLAHATVNGAGLRTGDLFASGTISGPNPGTEGSLIELTSNGARPLQLREDAERTFLENGDEVVLRGRSGDVELGEVRGRILAPGPSAD